MDIRRRILKVLSKLLRVEPEKVIIDPVEKIFSLEDNPGTIYVWKIKDDVKEIEIKHLLSELNSRFVKQNERDPQSLHLLVNNIEDIGKYTTTEFEETILPYLKNGNRYTVKNY